MELLQFLLSFLSKEFGGGNFEPIFNLFKNNSFDLKKTLSNLDLSAISSLMKDFAFSNKTAPSKSSFERASGLSPITSFADKEIVAKLNCYFSN